MAGRGPAPGMNPAQKPPERRARRGGGVDPTALRVLVATAAEQPKLPTRVAIGGGEMISVPAQTKRWWKMWADSPLSDEFTETDWSELLDTAVIHARFWAGDVRLAAELRLRVAKFGATPEDRARLRITFAQADRAEGGSSDPAPAGELQGSRAEYGALVGVS